MPTLKQICDAAGGELRGDADFEVEGVGSLEGAGANDLAPLDDANYVEQAKSSKAGALVVATSLAEGIEGNVIVHEFPLVVMNEVIEALGLAPEIQSGVHPTAIVDASAEVPESVSVGAYAMIGPGVSLGERCAVLPRVRIEKGVSVGDDTILETGCILHEGAVIGARCTIGSYAVISRQGFGFTQGPRGPVRLIHVGKTIIGDDSHVGALCCIDRARYDYTRVGSMSALDNMIHLGHNCHVGDRSFIAAQTGLAGHATVGNDCEIGGQVGLANNARVGDGAKLGAQAGVISEVPAGEIWFGYPAKPIQMAMRMEAALRKMVKKK
ncbi:MAG: UDP-3-O-(3-hydroxymyristoyl)glucosamine N-acyltransferase [Planctomycetota bacterium]|jgi:UDP-3-O-[3-hydroxymyristoyl] glucosamine N-acyltransferase